MLTNYNDNYEMYVGIYLGNPFGKNFDATREKTGFL